MADKVTTELTESDVPDVLTPGIFPGITSVTRSGNDVEVYTTWSQSDIILDGRDATDVAGAVCSDAFGDLGGTPIAVFVHSADGSILSSCGGG
jgi:hypothetical protein